MQRSDFIAHLDRKGVLRDGQGADSGLRARRGLGRIEVAAIGRGYEGRAPGPGIVACACAFDLDDVGAEVGEDLPGPGPTPPQVLIAALMLTALPGTGRAQVKALALQTAALFRRERLGAILTARAREVSIDGKQRALIGVAAIELQFHAT